MGNLAVLPQQPAPLVDAKEIADFLGVGVPVVRKLAKAKKIPALLIKNGVREYYRFRVADVEAALKETA